MEAPNPSDSIGGMLLVKEIPSEAYIASIYADPAMRQSLITIARALRQAAALEQSQKIKAGQARVLASGGKIGGSRYRALPEATLREIKRCITRGMIQDEIVAHLNETGFKTCNGCKWAKTSLQSVIRLQVKW